LMIDLWSLYKSNLTNWHCR